MSREKSDLLKDPQLRLLPMQQDDLAEVVGLELRCYPFPWSEGIFRDCLDVGYNCWIYRQRQRLVGYGVMSVAAGEAHILNICIDPDLRGRGLARRMLERLLNLARQHRADSVFLEVRASNTAAQRLYTGLGFNEIGLRRGYYPAQNGREDAILLALSL
ncbi:MAG: ribosomal protein S18-alanine N-acetyltransferase [Gammaproteobacteria bacterium]|nr:ribosomal protein S18-alanine N-acetyltransferase [Gammaproteobacteria bacterium]